MTFLLILALYIVFAVAIGNRAAARGRSAVGWMFLTLAALPIAVLFYGPAFVIWPIVVALLLFLLPALEVVSLAPPDPRWRQLRALTPNVIEAQWNERRAARWRRDRQAIVSALTLAGITFAIIIGIAAAVKVSTVIWSRAAVADSDTGYRVMAKPTAGCPLGWRNHAAADDA
jgi:hypothetical protein